MNSPEPPTGIALISDCKSSPGSTIIASLFDSVVDTSLPASPATCSSAAKTVVGIKDNTIITANKHDKIFLIFLPPQFIFCPNTRQSIVEFMLTLFLSCVKTKTMFSKIIQNEVLTFGKNN